MAIFFGYEPYMALTLVAAEGNQFHLLTHLGPRGKFQHADDDADQETASDMAGAILSQKLLYSQSFSR